MMLRKLLVLAVIATGCADPDDGDKPLSKEEAAKLHGKSDSFGDLCDLYGWYGDGTCDTFCVNPDPDCGGGSGSGTCKPTGTETLDKCSNGIDEDCDGQIDCMDLDCVSSDSCLPG